MKRTVLVVDDNIEVARMLCEELEDRGISATPIDKATEAARLLERDNYDGLVTDMRMPDMDGLELLDISRKLNPERPVIVMTAFSGIDTAVESIRRGAYNYVTKPFKNEELALFLERALAERSLRREAAQLRTALKERFSLGGLIGSSRTMQQTFEMVARVAETSSPVLITGETGTGKSAIARALHNESPRNGKSFVTVNCAALPEHLLESELFGHIRGAFTGAVDTRPGLFVEADGGTLFLDEIGEMAMTLQAKLLGVIEHGDVRPVGSEKSQHVDVRIVAATNRDLREAVSQQRFREDLLYRLDVVTIDVPPLRKRAEDIPALIEHFMNAARKRHPRATVKALSRDVTDKLLEHRWPGNVRELEHVIERIVILGRNEEARLADLPPLAGRGRIGDMFYGEVQPIRDVQRQYARWALGQLGEHKGRTAERLGIDAKTLAKWLSEADDER
jgi:two-component system response regulator HydG